MSSPEPNIPWWARMIIPIAASRPGGWFITSVATYIDRVLMRVSSGRVRFAQGFPSLILTTMGAKSGQPRTTPLIYLPDQDRIVLIASNAGNPGNPAWYYNLRKNPQVTVLLNGQEYQYTAYEADGAEREVLWKRAVAMYPGYATYQKRASGRRIPVIVLQKITQ